MSKKHHVIDMWYGDKFDPKKFKACSTFYPHGQLGGYCYAGNIFSEDGKKIIGDYATNDSVWIEHNFIISFGD